jgi:hypothetical protein
MKGLVQVTAAWVLCTAGCGGATLPLSDDAGVAAPGRGGVTVERNGEGVAMIAGTAGGLPFSARGAIDEVAPDTPHFATIAIPTNIDLTCGDLQQGARARTVHASSRYLVIYIVSTAPSVGPGEYVVVPSMPSDAGAMTASADYRVADPSCTFADEFAASGFVVVTAVDSEVIAGRLDVAFANGDALTGTFSAPVCVVVLPPVEVSPPPTMCVP